MPADSSATNRFSNIIQTNSYIHYIAVYSIYTLRITYSVFGMCLAPRYSPSKLSSTSFSPIVRLNRLEVRVKELEALLAKYEKAHVPPSPKRGGNCKKCPNKDGVKGTPSQKKGHKGVTRPPAKPDKQVDVTTDRYPCPDCEIELGDTFRIESKIIEMNPEPQPVIVTEYKNRIP